MPLPGVLSFPLLFHLDTQPMDGAATYRGLSSTPSPFWKHRHVRSCAYGHPPGFHNPVKLARSIRHHSVGQPGQFQAQVGPALPNLAFLCPPTLNTSLLTSNNQYAAPMFCEQRVLCDYRTSLRGRVSTQAGSIS